MRYTKIKSERCTVVSTCWRQSLKFRYLKLLGRGWEKGVEDIERKLLLSRTVVS